MMQRQVGKAGEYAGTSCRSELQPPYASMRRGQGKRALHRFCTRKAALTIFQIHSVVCNRVKDGVRTSLGVSTLVVRAHVLISSL